MTNAELIKALRICAEHEGCDYYIAKDCPRESTWMCGVDCGQILMLDAADALEAAEKRIDGLQKLVDINTERCEALRKQLRESHESYEKHINELEAQLPKDGEWMTNIRWDYQPPTQSATTNVGTHFLCRSVGKPCQNATEYGYCKQTICNNCGARMRGEHDEQIH